MCPRNFLYDGFGAIALQTGALAQPYAFTGRENDSESGLYFYRARYYDPAMGRFIGEDPIGFAAGDVNLQRYVFNGPANLVDPSGEILPIVAACAVGAVAGGLGQATGLAFGSAIAATAGAVADAVTNPKDDKVRRIPDPCGGPDRFVSPPFSDRLPSPDPTARQSPDTEDLARAFANGAVSGCVMGLVGPIGTLSNFVVNSFLGGLTNQDFF